MGDTKENKQESPSGFFTAMAGDDAKELFKDASQHLNRYISYLFKAIDAQDKKNISCKWKPLQNSGLKLSPENLFKIIPETVITLKNMEMGWIQLNPIDDEEISLEPDEESYIEYGKGKDRKKITILNDSCNDGNYQIQLAEMPEAKEIRWQGYLFEWSENKITDNCQVSLSGKNIQIKSETSYPDFKIEGIISEKQNLVINGKPYDYEIKERFDEKKFLTEYPKAVLIDDEYYVSTPKKTIDGYSWEDVTQDEMQHLTLGELTAKRSDYNESDWDLDTENKILSPKSDSVKSVTQMVFFHKKYNWKIIANKEDDKCWIQLLEDEDEEDSVKSPLDYFFEENVSIHRTAERLLTDKYDIIARRPNEYQILLGNEKGNKKIACYPEGKYLYLKPNISELRNQKEALYSLKDKPFVENKPLIELMENRKLKKWSIFSPVSEFEENEWYVLKDRNFDGCEEQRKFVRTALDSPDFAFLDGPPGTGKTTTILELICQFVRQDKKVLLAASTNAAINNILERLPKEVPIFATRLGTLDKADGVEKYVLEEQCKEYEAKCGSNADGLDRLVIESANLVCGTTSGIHRLFNKGNKSDSLSAMLTKNGAPFDVMIIDECSKTTFQEFVVPARLAKKWILVGDIRQLSPFTDRAQIVANLENIKVGEKKMDFVLQKACYYLYFIRKHLNENMIFIVSDQVFSAAEKEYNQICEIEESDTNNKDKLKLMNKIYFYNPAHSTDVQCQCLYEVKIVFMKHSDYQENSYLLPRDAIIFNDETDWISTKHAFNHFSREKWRTQHSYNTRHGKVTEADAVYQACEKDLKKKWADEICWRLERMHWLRFSESESGGKTAAKKYSSSRPSYERDLTDLYPKSFEIKHAVNEIKNVAFPSVLESLTANGQYHGKEIKDTLSRGFNDEELKCRLVTLTYQHRMHPDISRVPRELFYIDTTSGNERYARSLKDGETVKDTRGWKYPGLPEFKSHNIWINCNGFVNNYNDEEHGKYRNSNEKEAEIIIKGLKAFCEWHEQYERDKEREIAILTFYRGQEKLLRKMLQNFTHNPTGFKRFSYGKCKIKLATVDYFQGQEADIVFLSMVNTSRDGFIDSPNRLNVALSRARHQMIIVGKHTYYRKKSRAEILNRMAEMYDENIDERYYKIEEKDD